MVKAWQILLAGWIVMMPLFVSAGAVRLHPEAYIEFTNGVPVAVVQITNLGDEPFRVLSLDARVQGLESKSYPGKFLRPGEIFDGKLNFSGLPIQPDERPAVIRIHYTHANGNAFSSLALASLPASRTNQDVWVSANLAPASIGRTGKLFLQLLLLQEDPCEVTVRLILPDEFSADSEDRKVMLEPDVSRIESFDLTNHAAVPGATYSIFAIVERTVNGSVQCATVSGEVKLGEVQWIGQSYKFWGGISILVLAVLLLLQYRRRESLDAKAIPSLEAAILVVISLFIFWNLSPADLIRNTTPVGGDTPAHLYLVSHLKEQLLHHGRIISWAGGWWCGFPMFQYYFALPYAVAAIVSLLIPLNIAFKVVSVAGMVLTPCCAYWAARVWRLPGLCPVLLALAMVPFLFVQSHTMWGVNTSSTLAGMIANSWSFALMLPALALGSRDILDGVVRGRTILLFVLVLASHFFTSVIMFMTLAIVPFFACFPSARDGSPLNNPRLSRRLRPTLRTLFDFGGARRLCRAIWVLGVEAGFALMLMGWWLVPLISKSADSMDFGGNWTLSLIRSFPEYSAGVAVFAGVAIVAGLKRSLTVVWMLVWMCVVSVALFEGGYAVSPVFVNVRLWPFIFFAMMALGAVGIGLLLERARGGWVFVGILVPAVLCGVMMSESVGGLCGPGLTQSWARWNYAGLESKPSAAVFDKLMPYLKGTPGRLANDLCEENNQLGSSRIFELVPHLIGKPILEGGLVNSALGSMYSYYVQGETSPSCAGFPPIVVPTTFDFVRATRHLELFNVKHFIARTAGARDALQGMKEWRFVAREEEWSLFELMTHEGRYVFIPPRLPYVVETGRWKECSLEWLYTPQALNQFLLWKTPGVSVDRGELVVLSEPQVLKALLDMRQTNGAGIMAEGRLLTMAGTKCISEESVTDDRIHFRTTALGFPHIIKVTWFSNWKVRGAKQVYCISPGFMCVFPDQPEVELYYGSTASDVVGYGLTTVACFMLAGWFLVNRKKSNCLH